MLTDSNNHTYRSKEISIHSHQLGLVVWKTFSIITQGAFSELQTGKPEKHRYMNYEFDAADIKMPAKSTILLGFQASTMATITLTTTEVAVEPLETRDIATRLLKGTLHSQWRAHEQFATIDGLLKSHAAQPDEARRPLICYPVLRADDFEEHTAGDIDRYTDVAARYYMQQGLVSAVRKPGSCRRLN